MLEKIKDKTAKITIVGMGYIGLPTSIAFAETGYEVYGYDVNEEVINTLKNGKIHIKEPDLQQSFEKVLNSKKLIPTNKLEKSDVFIICVPTPFIKKENKKLSDITYVEKAAKEISSFVEKDTLVILESTVPPMTTDEVVGKIIESETNLKLNEDFLLSYCPERVLPGRILYELKNNDRIIGSSSEKAKEITKSLYESILTSGKAYTTDTHTAEMCKLVENSYRDVNIAFANELSIIADKIGINVFELIELANKHPRVNILKPGAGVGGHCLAVDPWFIVEKFPEEANIIRTAREINDYKPHWIVEKIEKEVKEKYPNREKEITIGILGLSYKPNIDDLRESPSIEIALCLKEKGYNVVGCEPNVKKEEIKGIKNLSLEETLEKSDYLVLTLAHDEFKEHIDSIMNKNILDVVGMINKELK